MEGRVQCQLARLLALINLISLKGRTPWLTSGLHAPTPPQFSLTATEPKHSATQEAGSDHSVTLVAAVLVCCVCVCMQVCKFETVRAALLG